MHDGQNFPAIDWADQSTIQSVAENLKCILKILGHDNNWLAVQTELPEKMIGGIVLGFEQLTDVRANRIAQVLAITIQDLVRTDFGSDQGLEQFWASWFTDREITMPKAESLDDPADGLPRQPEVTETSKSKNAGVSGELLDISIDLVTPLPGQPRMEFDPIELRLLGENIQKNGQLTPGEVIRVDIDGTKKFQLIDGERRLRACKLAGVKTYRAYAVESDDSLDHEEQYRRACIANFSRSGHTPYEELMMLKRLLATGLTQEQVACDLSQQPMWVSQRHTIMERADPRVIELVRTSKIPISVLKEISDLEQHKQLGVAHAYLNQEIKMPEIRTSAHTARVQSGRAREVTPATKAKQLAGRLGGWVEQVKVLRSGLSPIAGTLVASNTKARADLRSLIEELEEMEQYLEGRPKTDQSSYAEK